MPSTLPLRILILEDNSLDADLLLGLLRHAGLEFTAQVVATERDYLAHLHAELDIILADYRMPHFSALRALELLHERALDIPFVIISGTIGEEEAVAAMKLGATDYLLKDRLARVGVAVIQAVREGRLRSASRRNQEALRLFRNLVDQSDDIFQVVDPETGRVLDVNATGCAEMRCSREDYLAKRVTDIDPGVGPASWKHFVEDLRCAGSKRHATVHRRHDGSTFPVEVHSRWVRLERDYIVASVRNVTARREAEDILKESERRFRAMLENVELIAVILDLNGRVTFCNDYLLRLTGWAREEVLGEDWFSQFTRTSPELKTLFLDRLPAGHLPAHHENPIATRDGRLRDVVWNNTMLKDSAGNVIGSASIGEDVTERNRAEERLREQAAMLDRTRDAIILRSFEDSSISFWSRGAESLYGWPASAAIGQNIGTLICVDPSGPNQIREQLLTAAEWRGETRHRTKEGKELVVYTRATLVRDDAGQPRSVLSINSDITEQKLIEARLLHSQRIESIGTLAGGVAHNLNNILTPIVMSAPRLRESLTSEERAEVISTIEDCAARGAQIVKQVLTLSGSVEGERSALQIAPLTRDLVQLLQETLPRNIAIRNRVTPDAWPVLGDATQLHQVLLNLCLNARDAMPRGGDLNLCAGNITLDASFASMVPEAKPGPYVLVEVSDTGIGIEDEIIERIFDPFFTTKPLGRGTGLGLSTALGIVQGHGGFLRVQSRPGKGTHFQIYLPALLDDRPIARPSSPPGFRSSHGELILVVDDEASIRDSVRLALHAAGYRVLLATDGIDALSTFAPHRDEVSVIITDLMMAGMDGLTLVRALRAMAPQLPIVASTGLGEKTQLTQLAALGVDKVLYKPFGAETLLRTLHESLHPCPRSTVV